MDLYYDGQLISPRAWSTSIDLTIPVPASLTIPYPDSEPRHIRLTLARGQKFTDTFKRGQAVSLRLNPGDASYRFEGRVRFRRLNVCVIDGTVVSG